MLRALLLASCLGLSACATVVTSVTDQFAEALSGGILSQNDPATVRDGMPSYLLLVDGFIVENPDNEALLLAGAELYSSYAGSLVEDEVRALRLAVKARDYGQRAICRAHKPLCGATEQTHEQFLRAMRGVGRDDIAALYGFAASWATWIEVSGSWEAIADIPKVEAAMERVVALDADFQNGWPHLYLGVLNSLLPPAYGGDPDKARRHFETARRQSAGENLMVHVLYAEKYARLVFDQELHDALLERVIAAEVNHGRLTLINTLAQERARVLLAESKDYF